MAEPIPDELLPYVEYPTEDELRARVRWWLAELGCTFAELAEMARTGEYETGRHFAAWIMIGAHGDLAGE